MVDIIYYAEEKGHLKFLSSSFVRKANIHINYVFNYVAILLLLAINQYSELKHGM